MEEKRFMVKNSWLLHENHYNMVKNSWLLHENHYNMVDEKCDGSGKGTGKGTKKAGSK